MKDYDEVIQGFRSGDNTVQCIEGIPKPQSEPGRLNVIRLWLTGMRNDDPPEDVALSGQMSVFVMNDQGKTIDRF